MKHIAMAIAHEPAARFWEPFCGGLSVSVQLAAQRPGLVSDADPALISLYRAVRDGWDPPTVVSEEDYRRAKTLPDSDPLKAFAGIGCSFGAKWFGGYARNSKGYNYAGAARRSLLRDVPKIDNCEILCVSFMDVTPKPQDLVIYCDPPYAKTTGYRHAFDHDSFWDCVRDWERVGVPVYVSERQCPLPHRIVWEGVTRQSLRSKKGDIRPERLYRVTPRP